MIDSTRQYCEDTCAGSSYDQGIDDYVDPCNADLFEPSEDNSDDDYHSDYEDLGQPVGGVVNPFEYWTRGPDSWYGYLYRGPLGTNKLYQTSWGSWDFTHMFDPEGFYSSSRWPWLSYAPFLVGSEANSGSNFYILQYMYGGIERLNSINSAGKLLS